MDAFKHQHKIGHTADGDLWVTVHYDADGELHITGVTGPMRNGDAKGGCGQILNDLDMEIRYAMDWTPEKVTRLAEVWDRWHLNHLNAGDVEQSAHLRTIKGEFPGYPVSWLDWAREELSKVDLQPHNGYSYGCAWLREDVPEDVLEWLRDLPVAAGAHPWGDDA